MFNSSSFSTLMHTEPRKVMSLRRVKGHHGESHVTLEDYQVGLNMTVNSEEDSEPGGESELGKKEHWDAVYKQELLDLQCLGREGELWYAKTPNEKKKEEL